MSLAFTNVLVLGVYLVIAVECVEILRRRDRRQIHSMYLHISAVAMFIAITMVGPTSFASHRRSNDTRALQHFVTDIVRSMAAFTGDETAEAYYADLRSFASMFKTSIYNVVTWISDAFIVRCPSSVSR